MKRYSIKSNFFLIALSFSFFFNSSSFCSFQEVDLLMNGELLGEVSIAFSEEKNVEVDVKEVVKLTKHFIEKQWQEPFERLVGKEPYRQLPFELFQKIQVYFDHQELAVCMEISPDILETKVNDLREVSRPTVYASEELIQPQRFSAVCDLNLTQGFRKLYFSNDQSQSDFYGSSHFKVNVSEAVLDGYVYFLTMTQGAQKDLMNKINRGNVTLNINADQGRISYLFGDVSPPAYFFQNSAPLFGMLVSNTGPGGSKQSSNIGPQSEYEFFLNAPSTVDVYLNNQFQKTLRLSAGPHLLKNFPYAHGENEVLLKITDPMGNERQVDLNSFYSSKILPPGSFNYSLAVGFPRFQAASQQYTYEFGNPALSFNFESGINQYFSLRSYFQGSKSSLFSGINALFENRYFFLSSAVGGSFNKAGRFGWKGRVHFNGFAKSSKISWSVTLEAYGQYFSYFLARALENSQYANLHTSFARKLGAAQATVYGNYGWSRGGASNSFATGLSLSRKIFISTVLGMNFSYRKLRNNLKVFEAIFSLNFSPRGKNWKVQSNYSANTKILNVNGQHSHQFNNGDYYNMNLGFSQAESTKNITGNIRYQSQLGEVLVENRLYQNTLNVKSSSKQVNNRSTLASYGQITGKTAIAYAGKQIGFTKQFQGGFALVKSQGGSGKVEIDSPYGTKKAYISPFLSAVVTGLSPYRKSLVSINGEDIDQSNGLPTSSESFVFDVKNSSGFATIIGSQQGLYYVKASLISALGKPITHLSFILKDQEGRHSSIFGFTNSRGEFELLDVRSGVYELISKKYKNVTITIEGDNINLLLGNIIMDKK